jgi:hypothetical protein
MKEASLMQDTQLREYHQVRWYDFDAECACERLSDVRFRIFEFSTSEVSLDGTSVREIDISRPDAVAHLQVDGVPVERSTIEREKFGLVTLVVELKTPLPPVRPPAPRFPSHAGDLSFDEALARARTLESAINLKAVRETEAYWVFPVHRVGCCGVVVEKADGHATRLGSSWTLETWLWGYDRGLATQQPVNFVVTEVVDIDRAVDLLGRLGIGSDREHRREALRALPATFPAAVTWKSIGELEEDNGSSFRWETGQRSRSPK